jgi:hypothetical protein
LKAASNIKGNEIGFMRLIKHLVFWIIKKFYRKLKKFKNNTKIKKHGKEKGKQVFG